MSEINNNPELDNNLAAADEPGEFEDKKVEAINDPAESLTRGLVTVYNKYLSEINCQLQAGLIDREKADELTNSVLALVENDGLENKIGYTSREKAQEIMGPEMYFGPEEIKKARIEVGEEVPLIPFSAPELKRAKELGQMLIYRTDISIQEMKDVVEPDLVIGDVEKISLDDGLPRDEFFAQCQRVQPGWALVSKEPIRSTLLIDRLQQSELIAEYLVEEVFKDQTLPPKYQEAIDELNERKEAIRLIINNKNKINKKQVSEMVASLKINQLLRQTPSENIYDRLVYTLNTNRRLYDNDPICTNMVFKGSIVEVGFSFAQNGIASIGVSDTRRGSMFTGSALSRRF